MLADHVNNTQQHHHHYHRTWSNLNKKLTLSYITTISRPYLSAFITGVANVTSEVAFDALQAQFIQLLHTLKCIQHLKHVWQNVCICEAAIEITVGNKQKLVDLQKDLYKKYKK